MAVVNFLVTRDNHQNYFSEEDLKTLNKETSGEIQEDDFVNGALEIICGEQKLTLREDLSFLVPQVCFIRCSVMVGGAARTVSLPSSGQVLKFSATPTTQDKLKEQKIQLSLDTTSTMSCLHKPLIEALIACGERFIQQIRILKSKDYYYLSMLDNFEKEQMTKAREELGHAFLSAEEWLKQNSSHS